MGALLNLNELSSVLPSPLGLCEAQPVQAAERDWQGKIQAGLGGIGCRVLSEHPSFLSDGTGEPNQEYPILTGRSPERGGGNF